MARRRSRRRWTLLAADTAGIFNGKDRSANVCLSGLSLESPVFPASFVHSDHWSRAFSGIISHVQKLLLDESFDVVVDNICGLAVNAVRINMNDRNVRLISHRCPCYLCRGYPIPIVRTKDNHGRQDIAVDRGFVLGLMQLLNAPWPARYRDKLYCTVLPHVK